MVRLAVESMVWLGCATLINAAALAVNGLAGISSLEIFNAVDLA